MPTEYRKQLERQLGDVRHRRVALRNAIQHLQASLPFGDLYDNRKRLQMLQLQLRGTDEEWREVHHRLGRDPHAASVKLDAPARTRVAPRPAQRTIPSGILTRMIGGAGCR